MICFYMLTCKYDTVCMCVSVYVSVCYVCMNEGMYVGMCVSQGVIAASWGGRAAHA